MQDHAIFINQSGLYELMLRSKKPKAIVFKRWIVGDVIPSIKKYGKYEATNETKAKLSTVNKKLSEYRKRIKVLENNQKKPQYPAGGYVYIVHPHGMPPNILKPGRTSDLNRRLNTYNTSLPDNMRVVHKVKVDDPVAVEHCVKSLVNHLVYRKNKEFFKVKKKTLVRVLDRCARSIKKARKLSRGKTNQRDILGSIDLNESIDSDDHNNYYAILAVPRESEQNGSQQGGLEQDGLQQGGLEQDGLQQGGSQQGGLEQGGSQQGGSMRWFGEYRDNKAGYLKLCAP